ncbi:hypothetical protein Dimus_015422, partial [Dionaea muscipula]
MEEDLARTKGLLETSKGEVATVKERAAADSQAATTERERLNTTLAQTRQVVAQLEERQRTEVERVKEAHFEAWREEWLDLEEGRAYIDACSRPRIAMGYNQALTYIADKFTDLDEKEKWSGLPNFEDIGFRPNDDPYFLADEAEGELPILTDKLPGGSSSQAPDSEVLPPLALSHPTPGGP